MNFSKVYDRKMLWQCLFYIAGTAALLMATGGAAAALFPLFAIVALMARRPEWTMFCILLFIASTVGNSFFMVKGMVFGIAERTALLLMAIVATTKAAGRRKSKFVTPFLGMLVYIGWMCVSSADGWSPLVSFLKILLFVFIYVAFYATANLVVTNPGTDAGRLRAMVLSVAVFFIVGSFALIPFPAVGLMGMGDFTAAEIASGLGGLALFKGMTMHSQSLGPIVAATSTLLFADLVFSIRKWDPLYVVMLVMAPVLVYKSASRTAMGAYVAGMGMVTWLLLVARGVGGRWKGKVLNVVLAMAVLLGAGILAMPSMRQSATSFLLKTKSGGNAADVSVEQLKSSRQDLMDGAMYNFRQKPLQGNGFQVGYEMQFDQRSGLVSYLTAPIEKGVWVTAVLEEGGAVGLCIFALFLLLTMAKLFRLRAYISMSVLFVLIVSNLGEFTMFSMSYTGGYMWALIFAGAAMDAQRAAEANRAWMMPFGRYYG